MPTKIPATFSRINTTKLPAVNGWVFVKPINGGNEYVVSGSGQGQDTADHRTVHSIVREKISALGGEVPYMPGPNPEWESAASVVNTLLENNVDDPDTVLKQILPGIRTGTFMLNADSPIHKVRSHDGEIGVPTGGRRACGCGSGIRFGVRWSDGALTWICSRTIKIEGTTAVLL